MTREARRISRPLGDADRVKYDRLREQLDAEKDEIIAEGRRHKQTHDAADASQRGGAPVTEEISIRVTPEAARIYRSASEEERQRLDVLLSLQIQETA